MTLRRLAILLLLFAIALSACATSSSAGAESSETPTAIVINSGTGSISVSAADSGVTVTAEISSPEDPPWSAEMVGDEFVIDDGCDGIEDCSVDFTVEVAGTADVTINSADGAITVVDMNSAVTIVGAANSVILNGITGPISVDLTEGDLLGARLVSTVASFVTGKGDLDVTLTEVFESLTVISADGSVTAQVPGGGYDIDIDAPGDIEVDVDDVDGAAAKIVMSSSADATIYRR